MEHHDCDRFRVAGLACPFKGMEDHEDEEDAEEDESAFELALPGRKAKERELDNLRQFPVIAHGDPAMKKALERMAAIKNTGGFPSLPNMSPVPEFPLQGRGHREIMAVLSAAAIMQGLRMLRSTGSGVNSRAVQMSERRAAGGLSKVLGRSGSARTGGRGGLHVNAAADLQNLIGFKRKLRDTGSGLTAGFDSFSETGFP